MKIYIKTAQHRSLCNSYKYTKLKFKKTNVVIWFKKTCKNKHLKPNYINIMSYFNVNFDVKFNIVYKTTN